MVNSDRTVGPTLAARRVVRQGRPSRSGLRLTAAVWVCAAAFQLAAAPRALAQTGEVCECRSSDNSNWWLALLPAGAVGLLGGLLPGARAAAPVIVPPVERPDFAAPGPLAAPPPGVTPPSPVGPLAPASDVRIPVGGKQRPLPPPPSAYNGPVPRFKVLRQLLGVPESAVAAARAREAAPAAPKAAPARRPAKPAAPVRTVARTEAPHV